MKNIEVVKLKKYDERENYEEVGGGIYKNLKDKTYVVTLRFEMEECDGGRCPLEDVLEKYQVYTTAHRSDREIEFESLHYEKIDGEYFNGKDPKKEIEGIAALAGKKVYNKKVIDENGKKLVKLVIE